MPKSKVFDQDVQTMMRSTVQHQQRGELQETALPYSQVLRQDSRYSSASNIFVECASPIPI